MPALVAGLTCDNESVQTGFGKVLHAVAKHGVFVRCNHLLWLMLPSEDGRTAILNAEVIPSITALLQSTEMGNIARGAQGVHFLADHGTFPISFSMVFGSHDFSS